MSSFGRGIGERVPALVRPGLLGGMADSLDVVAVRVADKCPVVGGVVLGPHPGLVQHFRPDAFRHGQKCIHRGPIGGGTRDVALTEALAAGAGAEPEDAPEVIEELEYAATHPVALIASQAGIF